MRRDGAGAGLSQYRGSPGFRQAVLEGSGEGFSAEWKEANIYGDECRGDFVDHSGDRERRR